ncbi:hypothetical protein HPC38_01705 [Pasteurellaceae bacterium HPA106]|uniref:hypothetical protein n=1 Tax=Spirabiliibacterium pneumoniae TaxID=221400 RepID=UPI001AAD023D|nr:hypothetical protein [Spirabiliibacterium pneumoniae]MBE2895591.1 hypothetical protein [Spirabiliibacterium pneumoniae]
MEYFIELAQNRYKVALVGNYLEVTELKATKQDTWELGKNWAFDQISSFFDFILSREFRVTGNTFTRENLVCARLILRSFVSELNGIRDLEW